MQSRSAFARGGGMCVTINGKHQESICGDEIIPSVDWDDVSVDTPDKMIQNYAHVLYQCQYPLFDLV